MWTTVAEPDKSILNPAKGSLLESIYSGDLNDLCYVDRSIIYVFTDYDSTNSKWKTVRQYTVPLSTLSDCYNSDDCVPKSIERLSSTNMYCV